MPCHQIQQCDTDFKNADHGLLDATLKALGYKTSQSPDQITFSDQRHSGSYRDHKLHLQGAKVTDEDMNRIKRGYARQVISQKKTEYEAKGWKTRFDGVNVVFYKPQQNRLY